MKIFPPFSSINNTGTMVNCFYSSPITNASMPVCARARVKAEGR